MIMIVIIGALASLTAADNYSGLKVEPWGADTMRIRFSLDGGNAYNGPGALEETAPSNDAEHVDSVDGPWTSGNLKLSLANGVLTAERNGLKFASFSLNFSATPTKGLSDEVKNVTTFDITSAGTGTSFFGFGEHEHGKLEQAGTTYDMETCIGEWGASYIYPRLTSGVFV
jgi:hypothetical protein